MKRKEVLPTWIRGFAWLFLLFCITPLAYIPKFIYGHAFEIEAFGIEVTQTDYNPTVALYLSSLLFLSSIVAYGILWGKKWAVDLGIIYGSIALATSIYANIQSIIGFYSYSGFHISLEPLFLVPFMITLYQKRKEWRAFPIQGFHDLLNQCEPEGSGQ